MSKNVLTFDIVMAYKFLSKSKAKEFKALSLKKYRDLTGLFLAEGEKCVLDTLKAFSPMYIICKPDWLKKHPRVEDSYENEILLAEDNLIGLVSSLNSLPEVIAVFKKDKPLETVPMLDSDRLYILLDEIQDPGNLGTIIRTCDWFGVYEIFASKNTVDVYSPKVVQSTMGSLARVKVHYMDLEAIILKNPDIKVIGTLLNGISIFESKLERKGFLIMGNEGRGISEKLKSRIDLAITIPPYNPDSHPDSLNVAVATSIVLSHLAGSLSQNNHNG